MGLRRATGRDPCELKVEPEAARDAPEKAPARPGAMYASDVFSMTDREIVCCATFAPPGFWWFVFSSFFSPK